MSDCWTIGVVRQDLRHLIQGAPIAPVHWIAQSPDACFADPFPIRWNQRTYVFFEDYSYQTGRGRISLVEHRETGFSEPIPVLERPFHLSYPCVISDGGSLFMIPEQYQSGRVDLFECVASPERWRLVTTLIPNFPGIDPTVVPRAGMWWMFVGNHDDNEASHLYLFYAKQLAGPWHPHPANPVVRRAGLARAAGTPVHLDGRLVRPSQESRSTYGACVVFNAIDAMNEAEYSERPISVLRPDTNWSHHDGLHHVATFGPSTYIDAKSLRSPAS